MQIPKMPLSHPKDVTTQSNRVRRKVLKSFVWYFLIIEIELMKLTHLGILDVDQLSCIMKVLLCLVYKAIFEQLVIHDILLS